MMPKRILIAYTRAKALWNKACDHDGISRASKFVEFSSSNPYMTEEYYKHMEVVLDYLNRR